MSVWRWKEGGEGGVGGGPREGAEGWNADLLATRASPFLLQVLAGGAAGAFSSSTVVLVRKQKRESEHLPFAFFL